MNDLVTLTQELVDAGISCRGGFNRAQLEALGVKWPLKTGWRKKLVGATVRREEYDKFLSLRTSEPIERLERGGHFILAYKCLFRRNTLLTMGDVKIVVSSVGLQVDGTTFETLDSAGSYFETCAFFADAEDIRWNDADVTKQIEINGKRTIQEIDADDDANDMHEAVVAEMVERLKRGEFEQ